MHSLFLHAAAKYLILFPLLSGVEAWGCGNHIELTSRTPSFLYKIPLGMPPDDSSYWGVYDQAAAELTPEDRKLAVEYLNLHGRDPAQWEKKYSELPPDRTKHVVQNVIDVLCVFDVLGEFDTFADPIHAGMHRRSKHENRRILQFIEDMRRMRRD